MALTWCPRACSNADTRFRKPALPLSYEGGTGREYRLGVNCPDLGYVSVLGRTPASSMGVRRPRIAQDPIGQDRIPSVLVCVRIRYWMFLRICTHHEQTLNGHGLVIAPEELRVGLTVGCLIGGQADRRRTGHGSGRTDVRARRGPQWGHGEPCAGTTITSPRSGHCIPA